MEQIRGCIMIRKGTDGWNMYSINFTTVFTYVRTKYTHKIIAKDYRYMVSRGNIVQYIDSFCSFRSDVGNIHFPNGTDSAFDCGTGMDTER